jgi:predicted nucleic acid-binding protein
MALIVDTGVLYALADRRDAWHARTRDYVHAHPDTLLAPVTILPEVAYLLRARIGSNAERAFVASVANGEVAVQDIAQRDFGRAVDLMSSYEFLGFVDATVVAIAERLRIKRIATTDRRHFGAVRPVHVDGFTLVP